MLEPRRAATMLLPQERILAAGVFGVQDRDVAAGLLGVYAVAGAVSLVAGPPARREPSPEVVYAGTRLAVSVMVAVSASWIHICRWDEHGGATAEVARFGRGTTTVSVDRYRSACRVALTDGQTGYRLVLTGTRSRLSRHGSGVRAVVRSLSAGS